MNNYPGSPEINEVETLLEENGSTVCIVGNSSAHYDFDPVETHGVDILLETSNNYLFSLNTVDNEGTSVFGLSVFKRSLADGESHSETCQIDTGFGVGVDDTDSDDVNLVDVDDLNQGGGSNSKTWELAIDASDNLYFIGSANFTTNIQSFISKFNGNKEQTPGQNSFSGYFVHYGRAGCPVNSNDFAVNICDARFYGRIIINSDGKIVIETPVGVMNNLSMRDCSNLRNHKMIQQQAIM